MTTGKVIPLHENAFECPSCQDRQGEIDALRAQVQRQDNIINGLGREVGIKRAEISRMRGERNRRAQIHPLAPKVENLFGLWRSHCHHPRASLDDKRFERALWALSTYHSADCFRSILGYAAYPYVVKEPGEKYPHREPSGKADDRRDGFSLIFRDADHVEQGWKLAERAEALAEVA